ncbi:pectinesterase family protein [Rossellomorea marisflavi]|nr:pectin esterase [Rossellomorea marisflavi]
MDMKVEVAKRKIVVGKGRDGNVSTIQEALNLCTGEEGHVQINILSGEYRENLFIYQSNLTLCGIGDVNIVSGRYARELDQNGVEIGTFQTATVFINAENVVMSNLTITNDAGPGEKVGQAVAMYSEGDRVSFNNCRFKGYQDTICLGPLPDLQKTGLPFSTPELKNHFESKRSEFTHCMIEGTVDFIFGGGEAVFRQCEIKSLKRPNQDESFISAASTPEGQVRGLLFEECYITAEEGTGNVYLGRPWRAYGKTIFSRCLMGSHLHPDRWDDWEDPANRLTTTYVEDRNDYERLKDITIPDWITFIPKEQNEK